MRPSLLILSLIFTALGTYLVKTDLVDPDFFYHVMISKITLQQGHLIQALPQIDGLTWRSHFVDKEFLFHIFTTASYWLGGELGIKILAALLAGFFVGTFYVLLSRTKASTAEQILLVALLTFQEIFIFRLTMARPHLLSMVIYQLNIFAIISRVRWLLFATALLHPLSYHVLYLVPLNVALGALLFSDFRKTCLLSLGVFALGVVVHPYFPGILDMFATTWKISFIVKEIHPGLIPREFFSPGFLRSLPFHIVMLAGPLWLLAHGAKWKKISSRDRSVLLFLSALVLFWYGGMLINFRCEEYGYPLALLLLAYIGRVYQDRGKIFITAFAALLLCYGALIVKEKPREGFKGMLAYLDGVFAVIEHLPPETPLSVTNCFWNHGIDIFYKRPEAKFVDLLDPYLFYKSDPKRFQIRERLIEGAFVDPHTVLKKFFGSTHFLCSFGPINLQMETDPRFVRLAPSDILNFQLDLRTPDVSDTHLALFRLDNRLDHVFTKSIQISLDGTQPSIAPRTVQTTTATFSLQDLLPPNIPKQQNQDRCLTVTAPLQPQTHFLGIGGSLKPQAMAFDEASFQPIQPNSAYGLVRDWIDLHKNMTAPQSVRFSFCGLFLQSQGEFSLSQWSTEDRAAYCQAKAGRTPLLDDSSFKSTLWKAFPFLSLGMCS